MDAALPARELGYEVFDAIASGGMAVVHLGRRRGAAGFARVVAVKRLHAHLASEPEMAAMLIDEARLSARVRHPNVVSVLDVVDDGGLSLVMEYVHGAALADLLRAAGALGERVPYAVASAVAVGVLSGLHAAHEVRGEDGEPLHLVHRDVSPQNILVGADGTARIADFGIAKARVRAHVTREGTLKGKLAYMAPEQLHGAATARSDVLAAGVVLWEMLAGKRFYAGVSDEAHMIGAVTLRAAPPLAPLAPDLPGAAIAVVERALRKAPEERFASAEEMAHALQQALPPATPREVGAWVARLAGPKLKERAALLERIERGESAASPPPASTRAPAGSGSTEPAPRSEPGGLVRAAPAAASPIAEHSGTVTIDPVARRAAEQRAQRARGRRAWGLGAALLALAMTVAGAAWLRGRAGSAEQAPDNPKEHELYTSPSNNALAAPPGTAPAATAPSADPASPPAAAGTSPAPPLSANPPAATAPRAAATAAGHSTAAAPRPAATAVISPTSACDPPWELDAQGIKRIKRSCLK